MKVRLMTPGPCPVPDAVRLAIARPVIHHRSDEYRALHAGVVRGLRALFGTSGDVLIFAATGTGAMESAVANTLSPGDTAVVIRGGKFAERWELICRAHGARVVPIEVEWGRTASPERLASVLAATPSARAVFATLYETSTTAKTDIRALASVTAETDAVLVVDAISALGCTELRMDDWGVDVAIAGSQKGLMLPTGLSFAALSGGKATRAVERARMPRFYFDWRAALEAAARNETPWSTPASLVAGLAESLSMIFEEGLEKVFARHARMGRACREGVTAIGLRLLAPDSPAEGVTGVILPDGVSERAVRETLRRRHGVIVAGGQERLAGKIIRIAHMGYATGLDVIAAISALELTLVELGVPVEIGKGVAAAQRALAVFSAR